MSYVTELLNHLKDKRTIFKYLILWIIGGFAYICVELLWRGHTHISMFAVGGLCFILCGIQNQFVNWDMPLCCQMVVSAVFITIVELISGLLLNCGLGLCIWDYTHTPYNFCGQICLSFSCGWTLLSLPAIILDDYIRYYFFKEEKPYYTLFGYKKCHCPECEKEHSK